MGIHQRQVDPWYCCSWGCTFSLHGWWVASGEGSERVDVQAHESSCSFYQIMCLKLMRDVICPCSTLRLHNMLPIISPALPDVPAMPLSLTCQTSAIPAAPSLLMPKCSELLIFFNVCIVTHWDNGWEDMLECTPLCWTSVVVEERCANYWWSNLKRFPHMSIILAVYWLSLSLVCPSLSLSRSLSGCLEKYYASSSSIRKLTLSLNAVCHLLFTFLLQLGATHLPFHWT